MTCKTLLELALLTFHLFCASFAFLSASLCPLASLKFLEQAQFFSLRTGTDQNHSLPKSPHCAVRKLRSTEV